jgi:hypothetical protein
VKKLDYYQALAKDLIENPDNKDQRVVWEKIDRMDKCFIEIPAAIRALEYVGENAKFAITLPHDITQAVVRFLSTNPVRFDAIPLSPDQEELERMDGIETVIAYQYMHLNRRGRMPARIQIANKLVKHAAVAVQTQFIPFEVKRKGRDGKLLYSPSEIKQMKYYGDHNWIVEDMQNIYPTWTANGSLKSVLRVGIRSLQDLVDEYGDNTVVNNAIGAQFKDKPDPDELRASYVSWYDYMDSTTRALFFNLNGSSSDLNAEMTGGYELLREEHGIGFLNWVVKDYGEPLLKAIVDSGLYEHLAMLRAIIFSKALAQMSARTDIITSPNPQDPNIVDDERNPVKETTLPSGTTFQRVQPVGFDNNIMTVYQELKSELVESSAARALVDISNLASSNAPATAMNAAQSLAKTQLGIIETALQDVHAEAMHQGLRWIYEAEEPSMGFRLNGKGTADDMFTARGAQFALRSAKRMTQEQMGDLSRNDIPVDPDKVYLRATLRPASLQDEQANANTAIVQQTAGLSMREALEKNNLTDNPDVNEAQVAKEALMASMLRAKAIIIEGQAQMQIEEKRMGIQAKAQAQAQGSEPSPEQSQRDLNGEAQFAAAQGVDPRAGDTAPAQMVPGENRMTLNGRTDEGTALA